LHDFPNAQIVCSRAGLREIQSIGRFSGIRRGLLPALLPAGMERHAVFVEDLARVPPPSSLAPFGDCVDIFGDHSCLGVPLPGHAIGQFGVFFTDTQDRAVFLIADAAFSMTSVRTGVLPPAIAGFLLGHSPEYAKTLRRVHDAARIDRDMLVVPSHCTERCAELAA
jgi:glyoxylase-like metal-dependent hydrolase (beta-lactamase superfamily II)